MSGKFEGNEDEELAEKLYNCVQEGWTEEEIGSVQESGWFGVVEHDGVRYIVNEDDQGFFGYQLYDAEEWNELYDGYYDDIEEYDDDEYDEEEE